MVLPLQTWQYSEPKRLWPLLGGLSVLAHVGMLGLSLPYVLELMEPTGDRTATSSTPVELIVVDESAQATVPQAELPTVDEETTEASAAEESSAPATEASRPVRASADSRPSAISPSRGTISSSVETPTASDSVSSPVSSANDPVSSGASGATAEQTPATTQPDLPLPAQETGQEVTGQGPEPTTESPLGVSTGSASQSEESQSEEFQSEDSSQPESSQSDESQIEESASESGSAAATTDEPGFSAESSEAEGAAGQSENSESEPPVVEGEQLPAPGTTLGEEAPQVAALQVLDTDINTVQDQKDVPPRLLDDSGTITLQPESLGCGDVDFAQGPLTYRLAINADSTLRTVTPFPLDEGGSVQAVACLIRSAGFRFEAAISEGSPVLDDSLLMTVQVIEPQLE